MREYGGQREEFLLSSTKHNTWVLLSSQKHQETRRIAIRCAHLLMFPNNSAEGGH